MKNRNRGKNVVKTPMEKAVSQTKGAAIAGFISAGITALFAFLSLGVDVMPINIGALFDVAIVLGLAVLILVLKSRTAAIIILIHYSLNQFFMIVNSGSVGNFFLIFVFVAAYFQGILGAFAYHRLKKNNMHGFAEPVAYEEDEFKF